MIYVNYVYKNSIVYTATIPLPYTDKNLSCIGEGISCGEIAKPENYERYIVTETEMTDKEKLWVC